jgi:hypothetical protein
MDQLNFSAFFERFGYYQWLLAVFAIAGLIGYSILSKESKKKESLILSKGILVLVAIYEIAGLFLASSSKVNNWVYNIFNGHFAAILFLLLIRSFLIKKIHRKLVNLFIGLFLLFSLIFHVSGFVHFNDSGEYINFLNTIFVLFSCGLYFFELITSDELLNVNPLREFSFWASTVILFYFSSSFMIYISIKYLYTNHLDIFYMVIEIPRHMALLCNFLLCLAIVSLAAKEKLKLDIINV